MTADLGTGMNSKLVLAPVALAMQLAGTRQLVAATPEAWLTIAIEAGKAIRKSISIKD